MVLSSLVSCVWSRSRVDRDRDWGLTTCECQEHYCLSLHFNGHFPGEPGLAGIYWSTGWWKWWWQLDYRSCKSCKAPAKSSPPRNQHPVFITARMPFLSPNQQCQSTEGKKSHSMDLFTPSSPGVFQLCLWPLIAPGYVGGWLPCLSSALWCQYLRTLLSGYYKCTASIESTCTPAQRVLHQYLEAMRELSKLWRDKVMLCYGLCFHWFVCALEHV